MRPPTCAGQLCLEMLDERDGGSPDILVVAPDSVRRLVMPPRWRLVHGYLGLVDRQSCPVHPYALR